jgi:hypothetical protein
VQASEQTQGRVSIVELKTLARTMLLSSRALRDLILSEDDAIPSEVAIIKVRMYSRLLYREAKKQWK